MEQVQIQTAQNVGIVYQVASISDRLVAAIIDAMLLIGFSLFAFIVVMALPTAFRTATAVVLYLPPFFYHLACEVFMDGQSFGKKARRIKVVKTDGSQAGLPNYLLRWLLGFVEILAFSGSLALATIIITGRGQRLGDLAAGTCVVKQDRTTSLRDTIFRAVEDTYEPVYPEVDQLSDEDIATVKEVINAVYHAGRTHAMKQLTTRTKEVLETKMGITADTEPLAFLRTVLKDYNHVMGRL